MTFINKLFVSYICSEEDLGSREQRWREMWDQQNVKEWHCLQFNVSPLGDTKSNISGWSIDLKKQKNQKSKVQLLFTR